MTVMEQALLKKAAELVRAGIPAPEHGALADEMRHQQCLISFENRKYMRVARERGHQQREQARLDWQMSLEEGSKVPALPEREFLRRRGL